MKLTLLFVKNIAFGRTGLTGKLIISVLFQGNDAVVFRIINF